MKIFAPLCLLLLLTIGCKNEQPKVEDVATKEVKKSDNSTDTPKSSKKTILCFGNSLTAGYGLEDEKEAWPSLLQNRLDEKGMNYTVVNAGLSGETSSGGLNRINWVLRTPVDIFILELGANDMLRGLEAEIAESNLRKILQTVKDKYPDAKIITAGILAPPNLGAAYRKTFDGMFPKLAKEFDGLNIPFLLEGVALQEHLNLADGKHPNAEGQKILLENVWRVLEGALEVI